MDIKEDQLQQFLGFLIKSLFHLQINLQGVKSMSNQWLEDELHKPINRKLKKRKVYSLFKDNIWGVE